MEDSWQEVRILCILKGTYLADEITVTKNLINDNSVPSITTNHHVHEAGQSFFDIFAKLKSSHQKRGYQFIKNLVHLFSKYLLSLGLVRSLTPPSRSLLQLSEGSSFAPHRPGTQRSLDASGSLA